MPRIVPVEQKSYALALMNDDVPQREIEKLTGLSRPYLRRLAKSIGFQFPRNGIEVVGQTCMCSNCGALFRRPPSKIRRAKHSFCDDYCKVAWSAGPNHPMWKVGKTAGTFSSWVKNQSEYKTWREQVLERDGFKCVVSGRTDDLDVHHLEPKAENMSRVFDVNNGITLCKEAHRRIHELIREGFGFDEAVVKLKEEYGVLNG